MNKRLAYLFATALIVAVFCISSPAQKTSNKNMENNSGKFQLPPLKIEQYSLENGLRVVLNQDNSVPVVAVAVYYDVGSRNECKGRTGFAHLFEHMMFQGSANVKKAEHFQYISKVGGTMNGTTSTERTNYFEAVPANQLPTALWLESDRMHSLAVTEENLTNQRNAVQEEKRLNYDNQPYGEVFNLLNSMVYKNFANSHSTIGSMKDLDDATVEDVREFFRIYYAPNNAVLVISGAFDANQTKEIVKKYFGTLKSQPRPDSIDVSEPKEVAENYKKYEDKLAPFPAFIMGWKIPARGTREYKALNLAGQLLFEGSSSRLYQKLVKGDESIVQLFGINDERRGPSGIAIGAIPKPGQDLSKIREAIMNEIKDLAVNGPTAEEMTKLKNQLINGEVRSRQSAMTRAQQIAEYALYDGDPTMINTELEVFLSITPEQVKNVVNEYLNTENRALLDIVPVGKD